MKWEVNIERKNSSGGGWEIGFVELLQIVFIVLKLTKIIGWSWTWVLAPTWICALVILILSIFLYMLKED